MNKTPFLSLYNNVNVQDNKDISIDDYVSFVRAGHNQDLVLQARIAKQKGDEKFYKQLKLTSKAVTGSCTFISGVSKNASNISSLNGLIVIDIDNDQVTEEVRTQLQNDPYTYIMHESFGGGYNYCVFVRIDSNRFEDSFDNLAQYYYETYGIIIDKACKNKNRLRFLSYDPNIFVNDKAKRWKAYKPKEKEVKSELTNYIFFEDDFDNLLSQIKSRGINLCNTYERWVNVGMALASKFGISGADKFDFVSSFDSKYNAKTNAKHYEGFVKTTERDGKVSIGTFYYYCKEAGLDIYSDKTKSIINAVTVSKSQGTPTIESVSSNVRTQGHNIEEKDHEVIQQLIDSKIDYSKLANAELKEIEVFEQFVLQRFEPYYNDIDKELYINTNERVDDFVMSDIFMTCKRHLDLKKDLTENNLEHILRTKLVPRVDVVSDFFNEHYSENYETGIIEQYAKCIRPYNEFNVWAFKHWLVGTVYNWTRSELDREASPLVLVLVGGEQGIGKSTFIKGVLPDELYNYGISQKIDIKNNDSRYRLATSLVMIDEEFGGNSTKDEKEFKAMADEDVIVLRKAYGRRDVKSLRITGLAGTSNETDILKDVTGNRRILPITAESFDFEGMKRVDKIKMLCEAYGLLLNGFSWKIFGEKKDYLNKMTKNNVAVIPFEEIFLSDFSLVDNGGYRIIINQGDILKYYSDKGIRVIPHDIKTIMKKNKLVYSSKSVNSIKKTGIEVYIQRDNVLYDKWYGGFNSNEVIF